MANPIIPIQTTIIYANISQYLSANDISKTMVFKGGPPPNPRITRLLYIVRKIVEWRYAIDFADTALPAVSNYLYALCGKYLNQARTIIGNTGGTIIVPGGGSGTTLTALLVQFRVGDPGALMVDGKTVLVITTPGVVPNSVSIDLDGSELPINESLQVSFTIVYTATNITITFNQAVQNNQLYMIHGLRIT
jgi:hypothetical protein